MKTLKKTKPKMYRRPSKNQGDPEHPKLSQANLDNNVQQEKISGKDNSAFHQQTHKTLSDYI